MLSYQHHYHAGNHADVLKHWLLLECLYYLQKKNKPFDYIDTHAGAGLYQLDSKEAQKTRESAKGVLQLDWEKLPGLALYRSAVEDDLSRNQYPGSPLLVKRLLRSEDNAWFFELHPQTITELREHCAKKHKCFVQQEDGFVGLLGLLPNKSRRALVLIDPSYEIKDDYQTVVTIMAKAYKKMPQTMLLLWYPVVDRQRINTLERVIKESAIRNVQLFELGINKNADFGMGASGMIIVNPPWTLADHFDQWAPELARQLGQDGQHYYRYAQLAGE